MHWIQTDFRNGFVKSNETFKRESFIIVGVVLNKISYSFLPCRAVLESPFLFFSWTIMCMQPAISVWSLSILYKIIVSKKYYFLCPKIKGSFLFILWSENYI